MDIILKYFNVIYNGIDYSPIIQLKFKEVYKHGKVCPRRKNGMPYSGVELQYYIHYLGESLGNDVHRARKKLCSKSNLIRWYVETFNPINSHELLSTIEITNAKVSKSLIKHYNSEAGNETRKKLKRRSEKYAKYIGHLNSERWKDETWRSNEIKRRHMSGMYKTNAIKTKQRMSDPEFKKRFIEACNNPSRIKKISESAKQMWKDARLYDRDKFHRMLTSQKNKNYQLNGFYMNSIEYQVGLLLNELDVDWIYEPVIHVREKSYIPDFLVDNIIIEVFGDFWHANPKYFKSCDLTHASRKASDIWEYDNKKIGDLKNNSYNVIILWETDILNDISHCKQIIKENL